MGSTRDALVEAAAQLLDEGGVEAVTLRDVGRLVGVSHNAPYKHFAGKQTLLAAVAARELRGLHAALNESLRRKQSPPIALRTVLHDYIGWALRYPARFKLVFGPWTVDSAELAEAATLTQTTFVDLVASVQEVGALPPGDSVRLASLLRALTHGAADLALAGHLAAEGKGNATPEDLVDDLLRYLQSAGLQSGPRTVAHASRPPRPTPPPFPEAVAALPEQQGGRDPMKYLQRLGGRSFQFDGLVELLARASPHRSGDALAGCAAGSDLERAAARWALADVDLGRFLTEPVVDYESDDVTRLIIDGHDEAAFAPIRHLTVGSLREWLLETASTPDAAATLGSVAAGLTPEMVAAVSKLMSASDLITVARAAQVVTGFRTTVGLPGRMATRLQPNHPTDDPRGVASAMLDGLLHGCGDAVIGINPAADDPRLVGDLLRLLDDVRVRFDIPTQSCVLTHVSTTIDLIEQGLPVDLVFQSIAGTQGANAGFGVTLGMLGEAHEAAKSLGRGTVGSEVMYFETGQGSALSADAHYGAGGKPVDQQTLEARAYAVAREFSPFLVNTVVGFIGPEYLFGGREIVRAGLEDHFCGKLLGLPMGVDVCYTNHADADGDDITTLLTLLGAAGCSFVITVPGGDDVMLGYQSASFHDAHYLRQVLGLRPAPEFEAWLLRTGLQETLTGPRGVDPGATALRQLAGRD